MNELLKRKLTGLRHDAGEFARKLVATPSKSLEEGKLAELIKEELERTGFENVFQDDAGNVVGQMIGRERDPVILMTGHMDTAASLEEGEDSVAPGTIRDDKLYGPGAADCKGGLAAQIYAGALLKRALLPLRGTLVFAATVAEQNGCSVGLRYLLKETLPSMGVMPEFAMLSEPTDLALYYGHNGWFEMGIHVSTTDAARAEQASRAIYDEFAREGGLAAANSPYGNLSVDRAEPAAGGHRATVRLAHRLGPAENPTEIAKRIEDAAALAARNVDGVAVGVSVVETDQQLYTGRRVMVRHLTNAWETDPFDPHISRVREALVAGGCEVRHGKWKLGRIGMATGGGTLVNDFGIPTVGYGPGDEDVSHMANEYVSLPRITEAVYGNALMAHALIGVPVVGWTSSEEPVSW